MNFATKLLGTRSRRGSQSLLGALVIAVAGLSGLAGQHKVDARNTYERLLCVVPMTGKGTFDDPRRPLYAPAPSQLNPVSRTGILAFTHQLSDNGKSAIVEFVASDRASFNSIRADPSVKTFLKGKHNRDEIESECKKHKKDFNLDNFGVRMQ
jgi:hypothetical protein